MKVVIFCGGRGMRLESGNISERLPKPMASIGGRPLLWHIMSYYAHFGHRRFVLCLGYRGGGIRDYFSKPEFERNGWEIEFLETGLDASIGERFAAARDSIDEDVFLTSYGDTLTDADLPTWSARARRAASSGACWLSRRTTRSTSSRATSTTSSPASTTSPIRRSGSTAASSSSTGASSTTSRTATTCRRSSERLIADRELLAIKYDGFWSPMDTLKDRERLEGLVRDGRGIWQVWAPARAC